MMMYNEIVRDCFFLPKHVGVIDVTKPYVTFFRANQKKQVHTELYMHCDDNGLITKLRFKTNGNPYVIAALEWVCRQTEGQGIQALIPCTYQQIIRALAIPAAQYPVALHVEDVYKEVLALMKKKFEGKNND